MRIAKFKTINMNMMYEILKQESKLMFSVFPGRNYASAVSCFSENSSNQSYSKKFTDTCINLDKRTVGEQILTLMKT
jgi:hypothetical protein